MPIFIIRITRTCRKKPRLTCISIAIAIGFSSVVIRCDGLGSLELGDVGLQDLSEVINADR